MKRIVLVVLALIFLGQTQAWAAEWQLDPDHTNFYFEVKHTYATVRGQFDDFDGDVFFDPENLEKSKFDFAVEVDSINTNIGKRDKHLRSDDFFDAKKYPLMTFKSSRITHAGGNRYIVEGKLTIKDVSKDMALEFVYYGQKENPLKKKQLVTGLDSRLTINRLDYHIGDGKYYTMGVVGKDVDILITLEMLRDK